MNRKPNRLISMVMVLVLMASFVFSFTVSAAEQDDDTDISVQNQSEQVAELQEDTDNTEFDIDESDKAVMVTNANGEAPKGADIAKTTESEISGAENNAPVVDKVSQIYKDSKSTKEIHIYWKPVSNASGYFVYMRNSDVSDSFQLLTTTSDTELYVKNLTATTPYQFKVSAFIEKDSEIFEGEAAYIETATEPQAVPAMTLKRSSNVIGFSWKKIDKADGYAIYRASYKTGGSFKLYKKIYDGSITSYEDTSIESGRAYYYQVKAMRTPYTGRTYYGAGTTLKTIAGLAAPVSGNCTTQLRRVSLIWNKQRYAQGYYVYYSTSKNGAYTHLKTTTNTFYNSPRLTEGKTYYFKVIPYRVNGSSVILGTAMTCTKTVSSKAFNKTIGNTYIEISLQQQHMWMYINGNLYCETDIVSGNADGYHNTPRGAFNVWQRSSPAYLSGPTWGCSVKYWLAFTYSGCGIHDSSWRSSYEYGGNTYKGNGSHGCVNTPFSKVKLIYSKARIGTHVVVY